MPVKSFNPRQDRLALEKQRLIELTRDSDYVRVEPIGEFPGQAPEHYKVIFLCRGIAGIDVFETPVYADHHEVEIYCDDEFPSSVPRLRWNSPIWHPNIQHQEPKNVCVNKSEWMGSTGLDDLCRQMFEMVQYKNYHAQNTPPYPLDPEAAKWVRDYAEPRGIVDKRRGIYVDDRPFYKANTSSDRARRTQIQNLKPENISQGPRIKIRKDVPEGTVGEGRDVRIQAAGETVRCENCGALIPSDSQFCGRCGTRFRSRRVRIVT